MCTDPTNWSDSYAVSDLTPGLFCRCCKGIDRTSCAESKLIAALGLVLFGLVLFWFFWIGLGFVWFFFVVGLCLYYFVCGVLVGFFVVVDSRNGDMVCANRCCTVR